MLAHIIGLGGAGKTTTGAAIARRLQLEFIDLDAEYMSSGDIGEDISQKGYPYYVCRNIDLYLKIRGQTTEAVIALSSGFMTYDTSLHPKIDEVQCLINTDPCTILLMPSFDLDECIALTVSRQCAKSHTKSSAEEEEQVVRTRFPIYKGMGTIQVATNKTIGEVTDEVLRKMGF